MSITPALAVKVTGPEMAELDLYAQAKAGNQAAFEMLYHKPVGHVYALCLRTHTFPDLPENAAIGSAFFDQEENLIVQVVESIRNPNGIGLSWSGSFIIKELKNSSEQIRLLEIASPDESLVGIFSDGTLVMRYRPPGGQPPLRFRSP